MQRNSSSSDTESSTQESCPQYDQKNWPEMPLLSLTEPSSLLPANLSLMFDEADIASGDTSMGKEFSPINHPDTPEDTGSGNELDMHLASADLEAAECTNFTLDYCINSQLNGSPMQYDDWHDPYAQVGETTDRLAEIEPVSQSASTVVKSGHASHESSGYIRISEHDSGQWTSNGGHDDNAGSSEPGARNEKRDSEYIDEGQGVDNDPD